jgi:hypothetical protein
MSLVVSFEVAGTLFEVCHTKRRIGHWGFSDFKETGHSRRSVCVLKTGGLIPVLILLDEILGRLGCR